jgi:hypothetical protein
MSAMIFAEMEYTADYWVFHKELEEYLAGHFEKIESGLQGDSWFWILEHGQKVAIDTFSSMKHQIKATSFGPHVQEVIEVLRFTYKVNIYVEPRLEGHPNAWITQDTI